MLTKLPWHVDARSMSILVIGAVITLIPLTTGTLLGGWGIRGACVALGLLTIYGGAVDAILRRRRKTPPKG